jgi:hypothetical protein
MTKYVKWRKPRGGVKREDGSGRLCLHCKKDAIHAATRRSGRFSMDVWFCDDHKKTIKEVSE